MHKLVPIITVKEARKLIDSSVDLTDGELTTLIENYEQMLRLVYRIQSVRNYAVVQ